MIVHLLYPAFSNPNLLRHDPCIFFRYIDDKMFHGFVEDTVDSSGETFRHGDGKLITLSPDHLYEDGELQFTPSHNLKSIRLIKIDPDGHVVQQLFFESLPEVS
jgi:hypothetical protein